MAYFADLVSQTITSIEVDDENDAVTIRTNTADYRLSHHQDCCEHVSLHHVQGDVACRDSEPTTYERKPANTK